MLFFFAQVRTRINYYILWFYVRLWIISWWRHQMETFSALLALCAGNSPVTGEFPTQRPVTRSFDVFFDLRLTKRLSKQSWGWRFETASRSLWRHCNVLNFMLVKLISLCKRRLIDVLMNYIKCYRHKLSFFKIKHIFIAIINNQAYVVCDVLSVHESRKLIRGFLSNNTLLRVIAILWKCLPLCKVVIYLTEAFTASIH